MKKVRLAIVGTGGMARVHAKQFLSIPECKITAVCDVAPGRAEAFAKDHDVIGKFTDVQDLIKADGFDAVTIVTPDAFHAPVSLALLGAGKHVLCEKPLALNHPDAVAMTEAAKKAGVINMVNFSYRDWSAIQSVAQVIKNGDIGEVVHVEASYLQCWLASKVWGDWKTSEGWLWRLSKKHGSNGVLGDVGVHIVDFATFPVGAVANVSCRLKAFPKAPGDRIGDYVLDANDSAVLSVEFANGALGTIHTTRWSSGHQNRLFLKISGTQGAVCIDSDVATDSYRICAGENLDTAIWETVAADPTPNNYQRFITSILSGKQDQPDFQRGADVQKVLDACLVSDEKRAEVAV